MAVISEVMQVQETFIEFGGWPLVMAGVGVMGFGLGVLTAAIVARGVLRRQYQRIRRAERRALTAERLAESGAMASGLAHEIKNPLSTIGLNAQLLKEAIADLPIAEEMRQPMERRVKSLAREVERLGGILSDFLEYAGELRLELKPADVNPVVDELIDFFLPQAERHGVRVRAELSSQPLVASVDVPHLKQALLNLMLNAVQAMAEMPEDKARELIIRTERRGSPEGAEVAVHVIDTGPGMPPEVASRIVEPYFSTKAGGTGLGVPIARRLVEAHHGRLDLHTEVGRGTDFTVVLPTA